MDWEKEGVLNSLREVADFEGASVLFCINNEVIFLVCVLNKVTLVPVSMF